MFCFWKTKLIWIAVFSWIIIFTDDQLGRYGLIQFEHCTFTWNDFDNNSLSYQQQLIVHRNSHFILLYSVCVCVCEPVYEKYMFVGRCQSQCTMAHVSEISHLLWQSVFFVHFDFNFLLLFSFIHQMLPACEIAF